MILEVYSETHFYRKKNRTFCPVGKVRLNSKISFIHEIKDFHKRNPYPSSLIGLL